MFIQIDMKGFYVRLQPATDGKKILLIGFASFMALVLLALAGKYSHLSLMMAPLGASAGLLFSTPNAPLSQPVNIVGGHVIAALIGLGLQSLLPEQFAVAAAASGLSVAVMLAVRLFHPAAAATAIVAYWSGAGWSFVFTPVLLGACVLVALGVVIHRLQNVQYPPKARAEKV